MGFTGRRITVSIPITGQSQSGDFALSLGKINQIIVTSDQENQTLKFSLVNEKGDTVMSDREIAVPDETIRPDILPIGVLTVRITDPVPASGTVTVVALMEDQ